MVAVAKQVRQAFDSVKESYKTIKCLHDWANNLHRTSDKSKGFKAPILHTLQAIISCSDGRMSCATIESIQKSRNNPKRRTLNSVDEVCNNTITNHTNWLSDNVKGFRKATTNVFTKGSWRKRTTYFFETTYIENLVESYYTTVVLPVSPSSSSCFFKNHTHIIGEDVLDDFHTMEEGSIVKSEEALAFYEQDLADRKLRQQARQDEMIKKRENKKTANTNKRCNVHKANPQQSRELTPLEEGIACRLREVGMYDSVIVGLFDKYLPYQIESAYIEARDRKVNNVGAYVASMLSNMSTQTQPEARHEPKQDEVVVSTPEPVNEPQVSLDRRSDYQIQMEALEAEAAKSDYKEVDLATRVKTKNAALAGVRHLMPGSKKSGPVKGETEVGAEVRAAHEALEAQAAKDGYKEVDSKDAKQVQRTAIAAIKHLKPRNPIKNQLRLVNNRKSDAPLADRAKYYFKNAPEKEVFNRATLFAIMKGVGATPKQVLEDDGLMKMFIDFLEGEGHLNDYEETGIGDF